MPAAARRRLPPNAGLAPAPAFHPFAAAAAVGFLALDIFITSGPFQGLLLAAFKQDPTRKRQARSFLSQVCVRVSHTCHARPLLHLSGA